MAAVVDARSLLTFIVMFVLGSGLERRTPCGFGGLAIGLTVALETSLIGSITGTLEQMNAVRSFDPALIGGLWQYH